MKLGRFLQVSVLDLSCHLKYDGGYFSREGSCSYIFFQSKILPDEYVVQAQAFICR